MKRIIALILILCLAAAAFAGCKKKQEGHAAVSGTTVVGGDEGESGSPGGTPPEGGPGGTPPEGGPGGTPPEGGPGGTPPGGGPGGTPPGGGPGGTPPGGGPGGPGGGADTSSTPAVVTQGEATSLKDVSGNTVYSGSAVITFGGTEKTLNAAYLIDGAEVRITSGEYSSASGDSDQAVFLVVNGGKLIIEGDESSPVVVTKTGSAASDGRVNDDYNFYGINSGIVVAGDGSSASIKNARISTASNGSNAIVAANKGSVEIASSSIETSGSAGSRGLHATYSGSISANGVSIKTQGASSAALATDRGGGTVTASDMKLETNSAGSPLIYSTGDITVSDSTGSSNKAQAVVVEGGSSACIEGCEFFCSGGGNRKGTSESDHNEHVIDACGVFIYQSFSGDASEGVDHFTARNSVITVTDKDVPMFFITNITAEIELESCEFYYSSESFITAEETNEWGKLGSNGGKATVTVKSLPLDGLKAFVGSSSSELSFSSSDGSGTNVTIVETSW